MIRLTFSAVILTSLIIITGCSKESNIVAPSGSTITTLSAIPSTVSAGGTVTISAVVQDLNAKEMNGVGVRFTSSNPSVASFSATTSIAQVSADTNVSGVATVTAYTVVGKTGTADITADITGASTTATLTVQ